MTLTKGDSNMKSVFLLTIGDAREGGGVDETVGVYSTHEAAMKLAEEITKIQGFDPEGSYGCLIEELKLDVAPQKWEWFMCPPPKGF